MRTHDMRDAVSNKVPKKPFTPQGGKETKFLQKGWTGKDNMNEDTWREIIRKNLFYSFKEPWEPSHRCMGKGKDYYIKVFYNEEDDGDDEGIGQENNEPSHVIEYVPL
jgi:hypothetical protein